MTISGLMRTQGKGHRSNEGGTMTQETIYVNAVIHGELRHLLMSEPALSYVRSPFLVKLLSIFRITAYHCAEISSNS